MKLLGIETATELVGVAAADTEAGPGAVASVWVTGRRRHTESLTPAIDHLLHQLGWTLPDIDGLAVDIGPGLFTGLRVGVATAKGLALGLGVGLLGVTSLDVLAEAALEGGWPGEVLAVVDARRSEVFAARYRPGGPAGPEQLAPPTLFTPADLVAALAEDWAPEVARPLLAVGDGALRYRGELAAVAGLTLAGPSLGPPPPPALVSVAARRLAAGAELSAPAGVEPLYLRDADAKINWVQRHPPAGEAAS